MGVIYTHGSHRQRIKRDPTPEEHTSLIEHYYYPYHKTLDTIVEESRTQHGFCLIIDGHSYFPHPLPYEMNQAMARPEICLGVNTGGSTPPEVIDSVRDAFTERGLEVKINEPFSGSILPGGIADLTNIYSIMIEINRSVYMEEDFSIVPSKVKSLQNIMTNIVQKCRILNLAK